MIKLRCAIDTRPLSVLEKIHVDTEKSLNLLLNKLIYKRCATDALLTLYNTFLPIHYFQRRQRTLPRRKKFNLNNQFFHRYSETKIFIDVKFHMPR